MTELQRSLKVAGLFAGIGGLELGLERAGHSTEFLCEIDPVAREVLSEQFPDRPVAGDVRLVDALPDVDLVAAGFPCQDLSLAGTQAGLEGARSGLVSEVFRLISARPPEFVLLENVLYLVKRQKGALISQITTELERLGYRWAFRVVDTRGFGLPQRRQRVIILASLGDVSPAAVLFRSQVEPLIDDRIAGVDPGHHYGFYWTEGKRAVGWAPDAVPTIKGGSGLGIPSPPAIYDASTGFTGTPSIDDAERLQGFDPPWTDVKVDGVRVKEGKRWTLVGNAVSVPVAEWLGTELASSVTSSPPVASELRPNGPMPFGAFNEGAGPSAAATSLHVTSERPIPIGEFLVDPLKPLSPRAINGFLSRVEAGSMKLPEPLLRDLAKQARTA